MSCESEQEGSISFNIGANISGWFVGKKHLFISFQFLMIYLSHSFLCLPAKIRVFCASRRFLFQIHWCPVPSQRSPE